MVAELSRRASDTWSVLRISGERKARDRTLVMISLRPATSGDEYGVAGVHVRSWQEGYRGLMADDVLNGLQPEDRAARYTFGSTDVTLPQTVVAVEGDVIVGFATFGVSRDSDDPETGEIFALYVDPDHWGQGVGRMLISEARSSLNESSLTTAQLWVLNGNLRAIRFYERDGWFADGFIREDVVWGITVTESRYRRSLTQCVPKSSSANEESQKH